MSRGFTLIELVIIIVILGILASVAVSKYFNMQSQAMEATVRTFGASLKEASTLYLSRAVLEGTNRQPPVQSFWDFVAFAPGGASARNTITIDNSIRHLLVNPNADLMGPTGQTITLNLRGGATATYSINPANGVITETYAGF